MRRLVKNNVAHVKNQIIQEFFQIHHVKQKISTNLLNLKEDPHDIQRFDY